LHAELLEVHNNVFEIAAGRFGFIPNGHRQSPSGHRLTVAQKDCRHLKVPLLRAGLDFFNYPDDILRRGVIPNVRHNSLTGQWLRPHYRMAGRRWPPWSDLCTPFEIHIDFAPIIPYYGHLLRGGRMVPNSVSRNVAS
jgi:hypothetical protein